MKESGLFKLALSDCITRCENQDIGNVQQPIIRHLFQNAVPQFRRLNGRRSQETWLNGVRGTGRLYPGNTRVRIRVLPFTPTIFTRHTLYVRSEMGLPCDGCILHYRHIYRHTQMYSFAHMSGYQIRLNVAAIIHEATAPSPSTQDAVLLYWQLESKHMTGSIQTLIIMAWMNAPVLPL